MLIVLFNFKICIINDFRKDIHILFFSKTNNLFHEKFKYALNIVKSFELQLKEKVDNVGKK